MSKVRLPLALATPKAELLIFGHLKGVHCPGRLGAVPAARGTLGVSEVALIAQELLACQWEKVL